MIILYILIGISLGSLCSYLLLKSKIEKTHQLNSQLIEQENNLSQKIKEHQTQKDNILQSIYNLKQEQQDILIKNKELSIWYENNLKINKQTEEETQKQKEIFSEIQEEVKRNKRELQNLQIEREKLNIQKIELLNSIEENKAQIERRLQDYYESHLNLTENNLKSDLEKIQQDFEYKKRDIENTYTVLKLDIENKIEELNSILSDNQSIVEASIQARKREEEKDIKQDFYRIILTKQDLEEIKKLKSIIPYLRNAEPLNKVIWKVYYEKPLNDLIGRVLGNSNKIGIYKITNMYNQMAYVGQAVNISERWKQHVKRGLGAETATRNKLYPAMQDFGVENFTFELIEECNKEDLDKKEDFWQDYFEVKTYGYSIK